VKGRRPGPGVAVTGGGTERSARTLAPAKVNLVLDLLGPRPDGYTEIATVFQAVALGDRVEVTVREGGAGRVALDVRPAAPCPTEENLAVRAARVFLAVSGIAADVRIVLEKEIPAGAGLGGGSSDGAAVLRCLAALFPGALPGEELSRLAAGLGADVPYFLHGGLAAGRGRGDEIESLRDLPSIPLVLARPGRSLGTADVYREARKGLTARRDAPKMRAFLRHLERGGAGLPPVGNDLAPAAIRLVPEIGDLLAALRDAGARAAMTGSGTAVFGLFPRAEDAEAAARRLERVPAAAWVRVTRTLPRERPPEDVREG